MVPDPPLPSRMVLSPRTAHLSRQVQFLPRALTMWPSPTVMGPLYPTLTDLDPPHQSPMVTVPLPLFPIVLGPLHLMDVTKPFPTVLSPRTIQLSLQIQFLPRALTTWLSPTVMGPPPPIPTVPDLLHPFQMVPDLLRLFQTVPNPLLPFRMVPSLQHPFPRVPSPPLPVPTALDPLRLF